MRLYFMAEPNPTSHRGLLERPTPTFGALEEPPALWPPGRDQLGAAAFTRSRGARPSSPAQVRSGGQRSHAGGARDPDDQ
jgi:hypothetical protein